jgi:drug/metabolite transporter (DMT)-like permease
MNTFLYYFSISLAILSTLLYHVVQKLTPGNVHPAITLSVTYIVSLALCILVLALFPLQTDLRTAISQVNWASFGLAFALVGLEISFLLAYRAGWNISLAAILVNVAGTILLVPVGLLFFKEKISPVNMLGILVCIAGLVIINWKK